MRFWKERGCVESDEISRSNGTEFYGVWRSRDGSEKGCDGMHALVETGLNPLRRQPACLQHAGFMEREVPPKPPFLGSKRSVPRASLDKEPASHSRASQHVCPVLRFPHAVKDSSDPHQLADCHGHSCWPRRAARSSRYPVHSRSRRDPRLPLWTPRLHHPRARREIRVLPQIGASIRQASVIDIDRNLLLTLRG